MPNIKAAYRKQIIASKVTAEQYDIVIQRAKELGISISEYVRLRCVAHSEARLSVEYLQALMAEVCALRTIITYTIVNLTAGQKIDAGFMRELFAEADSAKEQQADANLARARVRSLQER